MTSTSTESLIPSAPLSHVKERENAAGEATRTRLLDIAWRHLTEGRSVSMQQIAADAGVTRQTVYFHFKSRARLLIAVVRRHDHDQRINEQFAAALAAPTAQQALDATLRTWLAYMPRILPAARALERAASIDDDAAAAWWDRMDAVHAVLHNMVQRLADEGDLDSIWNVEDASDIIWSIAHPHAWDDLVGHRSWPSDTFVERQLEIARRLLLGHEPTSARET